MKCCYHRCRQQNNDNLPVNNGAYHSECYKEMKDWKLFENIWKQQINRTTPIPILIRAENELVKKGYSSEYALFGLNYCIEHKYSLNFPAGLKYFLEYKDIKDAYEASKSKKVKKIMNDYMEKMAEESKPPVDVTQEMPIRPAEPVVKKRKKFTSILGGI